MSGAQLVHVATQVFTKPREGSEEATKGEKFSEAKVLLKVLA